MLQEINDIEIDHEDAVYGRTTYRATYYSDDIITNDVAKNLLRSSYHGIPFIESSYIISGNGHILLVDYVIDDCE